MFQFKYLEKKTIFSVFMLFSISFMSSHSHGQAEGTILSEDFLEGLSPSLRDQIDSDNNADDDKLDKLFRSETSVQKNKEILRNLSQKLEFLEERMLEEDLKNGFIGLKRFGDSFFSSIQSSFMPVNIPNLDNKYIVDVGDKFLLNLIGRVSEQHELTIQRDGSLVIPDIGKIYIAGQSLQTANELVSSLIDSTSLGINYTLTLSELRDIQVLMLGGIESPGIYTLSGGSSILSALNVAGGIKENGSYRRVEVRRNGEILKIIDLYDIFILGKFDFYGTLRSGDSIFVAPSSIQIPISGAVNNPAIYEALPDESLHDLINFAGGFSESFAGFNSVMVKRADLASEELLEVPIDSHQGFKLKARDAVMVPSFESLTEKLMTVNISGMVNRPGKYYFLEGEKLSDIIIRAGGYKNNAYVYGGALFRKNVIDQEKLYAEINYSDTINYIVSSFGKPGASNINSKSLELLIEEIRSKQYTGRVIVNFDLEDLRENLANDLLLEDEDEIHIPALQKVVYLFGEFNTPINLTYNSTYNIKDYLKLAGGLKKSASEKLIVIDPDGRAHVYQQAQFFMSKSSIEIYPGSIIYAPRDVGKLSGIVYASTLSPILSSLAISIASLNSISN